MTTPERPARAPWILAVLILTHLGLTGFLTYWYSPTLDEVAHLPAGLSVWRFGTTDLYRVNPPLVRSLAAVPILVWPHNEDWRHYVPESSRRCEWDVGKDFVRANGRQVFWLYQLGRWMCLPYSLLGLTICWAWGRELDGQRGALIAAGLWCFSPNLIGHGALITNDVAATSFGLLAAWRFHHWLLSPCWRNSFLAGISLGGALLTKTYWITLFGLWPLIALIVYLSEKRRPIPFVTQLPVILLLGIYVLNLGYGFQGTCQQLGDYQFYSRALSGTHRNLEVGPPGNQFLETWLGLIPVPLPKDYVTGIDLQKHDLEEPYTNYLLGEYRKGGWWSYYLIGLAVKVPLGTLALTGLGLLIGMGRSDRVTWARNLLPLAGPALTLLIIASLETGMHRHVRYVFPVLPLLFLIAARSARCPVRWLPTAAFAATIIATLWTFPNSLSFFNLLAGGTPNSGAVLIDSNLDWGQDLFRVEKWLRENPDKRPVTLTAVTGFSVSDVGIPLPPTPSGPLEPGWHLISVHLLLAHEKSYLPYRKLVPVERVGSTINLYHVDESGVDPGKGN